MQAVMKTSMGTVTLELFEAEAPVTVANFAEYVRAGFYDGLIFHRVIGNFMVQGGGFKPGMIQKSGGAPIRNEANNGVANEVGTIAMARTGDPHSASNQFFINVADNHFLNFTSESREGWGYTAFGRVTDGMDVIDRIKAVPTGRKAGHQDVPLEDVVIESITLDTE